MQCMPNKPVKFGLKFWMAAELESKYVLNTFPYLGKEKSRPADLTLGEHVVLLLLQPYTKQVKTLNKQLFYIGASC